MALDGEPTNKALFWRSDGGKTINSPPAIIFDGGIGVLRVLGFGHDARQIVLEHAGLILDAMTKQFGPCTIHVSNRHCELVPSSNQIYRVRVMVAAKKPGRFALPLDDAGAVALVRKRIADALSQQAELLGESGAALPDESEIDILAGRPARIPKEMGGTRVLFSAYKDVVFSAPCLLRGPWYVGLLRSHGYGFVRRMGRDEMLHFAQGAAT
jgi:hypothetical protein